MAEGFSVDLGALEQASSGVNGTLDEISAQNVSGISCDESAIGHQNLASTLSDFLGRWQRGVDNLATDGREIATRLTANVKAYRQAENDVHGQFKLIRGEVTGTGTDPGVH